MTRVRLKGINSKTKRLASGKIKTYYWAFKGGPPLPGKPGSPEFLLAYHAAHKAKRPVGVGQLLSILNAYQESSNFTGLALKTKRDYIARIKRIETSFATFPISALKDRRSRAIFLNWRDDLAKTGNTRDADYCLTVLGLILAWAYKRGLTENNPIEKPGRLHRSNRAEKIWCETTPDLNTRSKPGLGGINRD